MLRGILDNVLSGMKAGFKAILNLEHPIERKKMFNRHSHKEFMHILSENSIIRILIILRDH